MVFKGEDTFLILLKIEDIYILFNSVLFVSVV